ncbi:TIGR03826 family flagellar region protein [Gorillibacterium sp. sgz5001074]|uniref:TIGR03826 family flagellar region protein n=1 Tax=Gorillibacterium sp. sgz5001074 TaxID=3446695 RepID=UPI003F6688AE
MTLNVGNCSRCGKLYAKNNIHDVCPACVKEIDKMYENVAKYLRENRGSTIQQVSEDTEVPVKQIVRFIREGRISIMNMPNLNYPCESCGEPIREGHICENCRKKLSKDYQNLTEDEKRRQQQKQQENHVSYNIKDRLQKDRF